MPEPGQRAAAVRPPVRIVVVDDHEVTRHGLASALAPHRITTVGEGADVASAVAAIREHRPDVVLLDVRLPGGGGARVLQRLAEEGADVPPTLAISASDDRADVVATVTAGATGYLLKTEPVAVIADAVRATAAGEPVFSAELAGHLLDLDLEGARVQDAEWESLTDREREILRELALGHPYKRIATRLEVSTKTVEAHVRNVLRKLQVTNRHEATRWAIDHGFDPGSST
ncbi:MAG: response regulator transcription factor [Actinobacteria bacterium]|nr:response regulator transcription factor [Actinomycetota bacterium]